MTKEEIIDETRSILDRGSKTTVYDYRRMIELLLDLACRQEEDIKYLCTKVLFQ